MILYIQEAVSLHKYQEVVNIYRNLFFLRIKTHETENWKVNLQASANPKTLGVWWFDTSTLCGNHQGNDCLKRSWHHKECRGNGETYRQSCCWFWGYLYIFRIYVYRTRSVVGIGFWSHGDEGNAMLTYSMVPNRRIPPQVNSTCPCGFAGDTSSSKVTAKILIPYVTIILSLNTATTKAEIANLEVIYHSLITTKRYNQVA